MATNDGKYDELASRILDEVQSDVVLLVVLGGPGGSGISSMSREDRDYDEPMVLLLREMANQIESGAASGKKPC